MRKTSDIVQGVYKGDFKALEERVAQHYAEQREVGTCTECMQVGELNHHGVCDFCEDPYGKSALSMLLDLEEAILNEQE